MGFTLIARLPWEYRHPRFFARVRVASGVWLIVLAAILLGYDRGGAWPAVLVPAAALDFYAAYRIPRAVRKLKASRTTM